jgi:hypothetical protein
MKNLLIASLSFFSTAIYAATPVLGNASFEANNLGTSISGYLYSADFSLPNLGPNPASASNWVFSKNSGISNSNTAWGGVASDGNTFAFLQNSYGYISQTFTASNSFNYGFSFDIAQRSYRNPSTIAAFQTVNVVIDGNTVATQITGTGTSWSTIALAPITLAAGSHTLNFVGANTSQAIDSSAFIDNVKLTAVSAVPEVETYAMMLAGLSIIGMATRRAKKGAA